LAFQYFDFSVPDEGYSRNGSCVLNEVPTIFFIIALCDIHDMNISKDLILIVWFMVLNATFNNISVISWSVLLAEATGLPRETTNLSQVT